MEKNLFQFEYFPNEILIEILKNLDIQDIFRAFYNLNSRFNILLYSLNNLSFTVSINNYNKFIYDKIPFYSISNLIITADIQVDLDQFTHIHSLILLAPTFRQIQQLNTNIFPYLEHLTINFLKQTFPHEISKIDNKIFSNQFPHLQSCYLPKTKTIINNDIWTRVLTLRKLKVGKINMFTYKAILITCPNLYLFKFIKNNAKEIPSSFEPHINLKRMIIELPLWCSCKQSEINDFLLYVPNLEQFTIYHAEYGINMYSYLSYDWLSSSIMTYLPILRRINYYFEIFYFGFSNTCDSEKILNQIKEDFKKVHSNQYQSRLFIIQNF